MGGREELGILKSDFEFSFFRQREVKAADGKIKNAWYVL